MQWVGQTQTRTHIRQTRIRHTLTHKHTLHIDMHTLTQTNIHIHTYT